MLKATIKSSYFKAGTGKQIFVYTVVGTTKELAEFAAAKAEEQGLSLEEFTAKRVANGGEYLHHITPDAIRGILAEKTCNLVVTTNGNIVVDNTMRVIDEMAEDAKEVRSEFNKLVAQARAGLITIKGMATPATAQAAAPETPAAPSKEEIKDEVEQTVLELQNAENAGIETLEQ